MFGRYLEELERIFTLISISVAASFLDAVLDACINIYYQAKHKPNCYIERWFGTEDRIEGCELTNVKF